MSVILILFKILIIIGLVLSTFLPSATSTPTNETKRQFQPDASSRRLHKAVLFDGDLNAFLSPYLSSIYPPYQYHIINQDQGPIPATCQRYANEFRKQNHTIEDKPTRDDVSSSIQPIVTAKVSFTDVPHQTILCSFIPISQGPIDTHSKEYEHTITSYLLSNLARLPTSLRIHVDYIISFPTDTHPPPSYPGQNSRDQSPQDSAANRKNAITPHAFMSDRAVVFFGMPSFGTWIHEFAHALDVEEVVPSSGANSFTESNPWMSALTSDSCVTDEYALISPSEAFAQAAILKLLLLSNNRRGDDQSVNQTEKSQSSHQSPREELHLRKLLESTACMRRQLDTFDQLKCFNPLDRPNRCPNGSVGPIPSSTLVGDGNSRNEESTTASTIANRHEMVIEPQANATGATWVELWLVTVIILLLLVVAFT